MQLPERLVALALAFALDLKNLLGAGGWGGSEGNETPEAICYPTARSTRRRRTGQLSRELEDAARRRRRGGGSGGDEPPRAGPWAGPRLAVVPPRRFSERLSDCTFWFSNEALRSETNTKD